MDRYRSYGEKDDRPKEVGDGAFIGVDEYNAAENIRPGNVQKAVNHDFAAQDANTRGGFVCLPELGSQNFGNKWQLAASVPTGDTRSVAFGNDLFVAVGSEYVAPSTFYKILYSSDGNTWTAIDITSLEFDPRKITFGNGRFVVSGQPYGTGTASFIWSDDGKTWTKSVTNTTAYRAFELIAYGAGRFVAATTFPDIPDRSYTAVSTDNGVTWTVTAQAIGTRFSNGISFANSRFVTTSASQYGYLVQSADGVTWVQQDVGAGLYTWGGVAFGNGVYSVVGEVLGTSQFTTATSPDFATWTYHLQNTDPVRNVIFHCGVFVGFSLQGRIATSINGSSYLQSDSAYELFSAVGVKDMACSTQDRFVAVLGGNSNTLAYSDNVSTVCFATGLYSDPFEKDRPWMMVVANSEVGFFAFGKASKTVSLGAYRVTEQSTIVQANNYVYLFRGDDATPLRWDGAWDNAFELVPNTTLPSSFSSIPNSNQATFYQNRLWVRDGKDSIAASDVLAFTDFDPQANEFNLNTGNSDYIVTTFPFGTNSLVVFKNKSILVLNNVEGSLLDVTSTEVTRQVGAIGINAVTSIGPDLAYVSYGNINLLTLTSTNNALQHKTLPLSARIRKIMNRVNWEVGYKISLGYWSNKLYVALPLDNSEFCNAVVVYNFITEQWFGEWNFSPDLNMCIQGWQVTDYLGLQRLHAITEDGRIFVTDEGQNDISGTTVSEISTELVTRAYVVEEGNHFQRRIYLDLATNRPKFSCAAYTEGASEESVLVTDQTYSRSESWKWADSAYDLTNANDDYNRAYRKDYSTGPASVQTGSGFEPEMLQELRLPLLVRRQGRLSWIKVTNTQGFISVMSLAFETRPGQRANFVQV